MKSKQPMTVSQALKAGIKAAVSNGETLYTVAKGAGIDYAQIHRFNSGERGLQLDAVDRLAAFLKLELRPAE